MTNSFTQAHWEELVSLRRENLALRLEVAQLRDVCRQREEASATLWNASDGMIEIVAHRPQHAQRPPYGRYFTGPGQGIDPSVVGLTHTRPFLRAAQGLPGGGAGEVGGVFGPEAWKNPRRLCTTCGSELKSLPPEILPEALIQRLARQGLEDHNPPISYREWQRRTGYADLD